MKDEISLLNVLHVSTYTKQFVHYAEYFWPLLLQNLQIRNLSNHLVTIYCMSVNV
jgi:hypothetical protein